MTDQPDDDFDATEFAGYPKFPTLLGYFGGHTVADPAGPDEEAFRHGHGHITSTPGRLFAIPTTSDGHEAAAEQHIKWAHEQQERDGEFDTSVSDNATLAIAEATLALAEQQRIANLIAWQQLTGESSRVAVRKALGLTTEEEANS